VGRVEEERNEGGGRIPGKAVINISVSTDPGCAAKILIPSGAYSSESFLVTGGEGELGKKSVRGKERVNYIRMFKAPLLKL
jgi:hypothetical protein